MEKLSQSSTIYFEACAIMDGKTNFKLQCVAESSFFGSKKKRADHQGVKSVNNWLDDNIVLVSKGVLLCGRLDKALLGAVSGGFVDMIARDFPTEACNFISEIQRLAIASLSLVGFTCSFEDTKITHQTYNWISRNLDHVSLRIEKKTCVNEDDIVSQLLSSVDRNALSAISCLRSNNRVNGLLDMIDSGSKGSEINLSQISGCVGMQTVTGKRIFATGDPTNRTLPCFEKGNHSAEAHGFVSNSYNTGINPSESFSHLMGGREGLVDTAVKTAQIGYISRRVSKMIESSQANYRGSILLGNGEILQSVYYGDGFVAEKIESVYCKRTVNISSWASKRNLFKCKKTFDYAISLSKKGATNPREILRYTGRLFGGTDKCETCLSDSYPA